MLVFLISLICEIFSSLRNLSSNIFRKNVGTMYMLHKRGFHLTKKKLDLMEFFDEEKNWGEKEIRSGIFNFYLH